MPERAGEVTTEQCANNARQELVDVVTAALVDERWGPFDPSQGDPSDWEMAKEGDRNGSADDVAFVLELLRSLPVEQRMEAMGMRAVTDADMRQVNSGSVTAWREASRG